MSNIFFDMGYDSSKSFGIITAGKKDNSLISENTSGNATRKGYDSKNFKVKQYYKHVMPSKKLILSKDTLSYGSNININGNATISKPDQSASPGKKFQILPKLWKHNVDVPKRPKSNNNIVKTSNNDTINTDQDNKSWGKKYSVNSTSHNNKSTIQRDCSLKTTLSQKKIPPSETKMTHVSISEADNEFIKQVAITNGSEKNGNGQSESVHKNLQVKMIEDKRKFSIVDIEKAASIASKVHSHSLCTDQMNKNSQSILSFDNRKVKAYYILAKSDVMPLKYRLIFCKASDSIKKIYPPRKVIRDYAVVLENRIRKEEALLADYEAKNGSMLFKQFKPSVTAQSGINFLSKKDEQCLLNYSEFDTVYDMFRFIYSVLQCKYDHVENKLLISNLFTSIIPKFHVSDLKSLFFKAIPNNLLLSPDFLSIANSIVEKNQNIFNTSYVLKICRPASYLTFILKELHDYVNLKSSDGTSIAELRKKKNKILEMKEKLIKYQKLNEDI